MESQKSKPESGLPSTPVAPVSTSCRKKKDHIDEFVNASMDEHKTCSKNTIQKMFGMSKDVAEKNLGAKEVESVLPLETTLSD
ncbi:hypothetical protein MKX01_038322 [Papaver californicum]|nr:hypothetical protein MKX01_038322 [Papaver californicum]